MRVAIIGAPSCGKSALAADIYTQLKQSGHNVELVHEWIRFDIMTRGSMTSIWEQYRTRQYQKELEDAVPSNVDYVIVDGGLLLPYFFAVLYADPNEPRQRVVLQDMYRYLLDDLYLQRYDKVFYLPLLAGRQREDGTRYQTEAEIALLDEHIRLMFTKLHRLPFVSTVNGGFDQRLDEVMWKILGADYLTLQYNPDTIQIAV